MGLGMNTEPAQGTEGKATTKRPAKDSDKLHHAPTLLTIELCVIHPPAQFGFPAADAPQKKFNSRLVVPTLCK
jgi:hypothetical protein